MRKLLKLVILALAGYGCYVLWNRFGGSAGASKLAMSRPTDRRIEERSELTVEELSAGSDDPVAQATAILTESDERSELSRDEPGIERRRSQDTVEP